MPSLTDFGLQIPFGTLAPAVIAGNPSVHPSTIDSVELDYDRALPAIGSSMRAALFAQRNRDLIVPPFGAPPAIGPAGFPVLLTSNVGSSDAFGLELGLTGHAESGFRWRLSYAFVATTDNTTLNQGGLITSDVDYARSVPRNVVTGGIGYSRDRLEVDLLGRWQSTYRDFQSSAVQLQLQPVEIRNYITLNARVGYRLTDIVTFAVVAQQFNVSRQLVVAGPPVERQILVSVTARF